MKPETKLFIGFSAMLLIATGGMFWYVNESKPGGLFSNDEGQPSIDELPNMGGEDNTDDNEEDTPRRQRVDEFSRPQSDSEEDDTEEEDVPEEDTDEVEEEEEEAVPDDQGQGGDDQQGGGGGGGSNSPYMGVPYTAPPIIETVKTNPNPNVTTPKKQENVSVAKQLSQNALTNVLSSLGVHNTQTTTTHVAPPRRNRSLHRAGAKRTGFRR